MIVDGREVHLSQKFSVPVESLFASCVRGELIKVCTGDLLKKSGNFVAGELYNCEIKGGADFIRGEFKEIVPNSKIVFTWETLAGDESTGVTTITLTFKAAGPSCVLDFTQKDVSSFAAAEDQDEGWTHNLKVFADSVRTE